jgi:type IV pilus assembly protein PilN
VRFNVNLATRPYEDAGQFYRRWIPILVILAVIALAVSAKAFSVFRDSRRANREIATIDQRLNALQQQRQQAGAVLARPENIGTRDTAQFLNDRFSLKRFSWTRVLNDLEGMVPTGVQVTSIKPALDDTRLRFEMDVSSPNRGRIIELVRRMESATQFVNPAIVSEAVDERGMHAVIQATYISGGPQ